MNSDELMYKQKYLKYKQKYLELKQRGGEGFWSKLGASTDKKYDESKEKAGKFYDESKEKAGKFYDASSKYASEKKESAIQYSMEFTHNNSRSKCENAIREVYDRDMARCGKMSKA